MNDGESCTHTFTNSTVCVRHFARWRRHMKRRRSMFVQKGGVLLPLLRRVTNAVLPARSHPSLSPRPSARPPPSPHRRLCLQLIQPCDGPVTMPETTTTTTTLFICLHPVYFTLNCLNCVRRLFLCLLPVC